MIDQFSGEYRFLSNFQPVVVTLDGAVYPSVENAYQAAKTSSPSARIPFSTCTPGEAKRHGRLMPLRSGWDDMKIGVMDDLIHQKFAHGTHLADRLMDTGDHDLIEGNTWGDTFWGVCRGHGENHLGRLLMFRRESLQHLRRIDAWDGLPASASPLEREAAIVSALAHERQQRKGGGCYITHPETVASICRSVLDDSSRSHEILAAAWLHDTVEDTSTTLDDIALRFGIRVADLVRMVTNVSDPSDGSRAQRKAIDHAHILTASDEGKLIKLADVIHNLSSVHDLDDKFARTFINEKRMLLDLIDDPKLPLMAMARDVLRSVSWDE